MAITEPHLGCFYQTDRGIALCLAILPGEMQLSLSIDTIIQHEKAGDAGPHLYERFNIGLEDPTLREVYCFLDPSVRE